ncbi:hypothetical protein PsorP6_016523 [Peronosclerospora sorghi]|uniref:Uncharacterized protein n=1 Tax=Peronosclerospora sorghi TaxID=230839 RepID=A0ACC0VS84_9STRA|nr:hypothetical protein PsorP6_016523 [Peronosclerospora sorghi]
MNKYKDDPSTLTPTTIDSFEAVLHEQTGLGESDSTGQSETRTTDLVVELGEVYAGRFDGQRVAISAMKGIIPHVNDFLSEAKINGGLRHPHSIPLLGVAWNSLADICVVSDYMNSSELHMVWNNFENEQLPVGFT